MSFLANTPAVRRDLPNASPYGASTLMARWRWCCALQRTADTQRWRCGRNAWRLIRKMGLPMSLRDLQEGCRYRRHVGWAKLLMLFFLFLFSHRVDCSQHVTVDCEPSCSSLGQLRTAGVPEEQHSVPERMRRGGWDDCYSVTLPAGMPQKNKNKNLLQQNYY